MKYTVDEAMAEIMRRGDMVVKKRSQRKGALLAGSSLALSAALIAVIIFMPGGAGTPITDSVYGSFLLSAESGGYVLVAVIAFALGITLTLLCLYFVGRNKKSAESKEGKNKMEGTSK